MKPDPPFLESALRELRTAPVPDDLFDRLVAAEPDIGEGRSRPGWQFAGWSGLAIAAAACLVLAVRFFPGPPATSVQPVAAHPTAHRIHHEAALLDERVLAVIHRDGRYWELAEEQWIHHTELVSDVPASEVSATALDRQFVCRPVIFD